MNLSVWNMRPTDRAARCVQWKRRFPDAVVFDTRAINKMRVVRHKRLHANEPRIHYPRGVVRPVGSSLGWLAVCVGHMTD